jgi:hypothetical protein
LAAQSVVEMEIVLVASRDISTAAKRVQMLVRELVGRSVEQLALVMADSMVKM